eukprot:snap_masked-scaffold_2-processed-gene-27.20-mRNA-1 protein AED:1.00 eAED:1.00 QI:0/0/0/0/1/1/2/0/451
MLYGTGTRNKNYCENIHVLEDLKQSYKQESMAFKGTLCLFYFVLCCESNEVSLIYPQESKGELKTSSFVNPVFTRPLVEEFSTEFNGKQLMLRNIPVCFSSILEEFNVYSQQNIVSSLPNWVNPMGLVYTFNQTHPRKLKNAFSFLEGSTLVFTCWRQFRDGSNPAHFLIGYGRLFSYLHDTQMPHYVDNILLLHCALPNSTHWTNYVSSFILKEFNKMSKTNFAEKLKVYILPKELNQLGAVLCSSNTIFTEYIRQPLGNNHKDLVRLWKFHHQYFSSNFASNSFNCFNPRIGLYFRSQGSSLRKIVNEEKVIELIRKFTNNFIRFTTFEDESFPKQQQKFVNLDILVTPHGAHLSNLIFVTKDIQVIELSMEKLFFSYENFLQGFVNFSSIEGNGFVPRRSASFRKRTTENMDEREEIRYRINARNSYLNVNLRTLETRLEDVINNICS